MFKGVSTLQAYEQCLKRGICERHIKELNQNEHAVREAELPRKAFLFIRVNLLYALLFKKSVKCEKVKILLQRTPVFSRVLAKGDVSEAVDAILVLDSVVVFTLCQLSKACCIGALFQKDNVTSEDPDIKQLQNLLFVDRIEGAILHHLYPLLQKNFVGYDLDVIKVSYVLTLLFVRNYCVKLNIKTAPEIIEEEFKGCSRWESLKKIGDNYYQIEHYGDALNAYSSAMMLNSYSSELFTQRAQAFLKLGKFKAAQLDAYVAVIIDPKCCEGYYVFTSSLIQQKLYQDAFEFATYGLTICELSGSFYESLQRLHIKIDNYLRKGVNIISENSVNHSDSTEKKVPEKKYFPELVDSDSADSESEIVSKKNVPELVDTSDSDDSETVEKKTVNTQTKNKTKKKRIPSEDTISVMSTQMEMIKVHTFLKEASEAILSDCGYKAVQIFRGPLRDFIDSPKLNTYEECEVVCIKYAYGIAYCKSGEYDDLLKCITILKEIIEKHDSVTFPAAYYALGFTYRKLNRFKEALNYLETVKNFLSKGIHFKVYPWPERTTVIQETKPEILKVLVENLIKECENPPNPDALCRFADCCFQPTIYYTDPDFKGYISLLCSEQCCLQYHLQCWKTIKTEKKLTDKEFLEQICFTPDCEGVIIKVQNIDKKGDLAKEFTSDLKKNTKQKWAKWEKKADIKEKKKKRVNSRSDDGFQEVPSESGKVSSRKNSDANERSTIIHSSGSAIPSVEKDASSVEKDSSSVEKDASSENMQKILQKVKELELDDATKKDNICSSSVNDVQEIQVVPCVSDEYISAQGPDVLHVSEKENEYNSAQEIPDINSVSEKENECSHMPNLTSEFQNETEFSSYLQENTAQYLVSQCIKNNVYSYMSDFLQHHGPLRTDDKLLTDEMASFPDEINTMITECGGIGEFLKNDLRFAFVGDIYICVVSDLAAAYKMNISSSLPADLESLQSLESADHSKYYDGCSMDSQKQNFGLNPDALEYTPAVKSVGNKNTKKINTNNSLPKNLNVSNFALDPESLDLSSDNTTAISNSQMSKSKSCDTVSDSKFCDDSKSIFSDIAHSEKIAICAKENCKGLSNEHVYISELSSKAADSDVNAINCNQNIQESNGNLCTDFANLSLCGVNKEIQDNSNSSENSKIKKIQTQLLPVLKEICSEDFNNYRQYIDACIKPYAVRKLTETATTGTETDFEIVSAERLRFLEDTLKTVKKQLTEQILTLKNQLSSTVKENNDLEEEVSKLKTSLSTSSFDLEVLKIDHKKKVEESLNGREYLLKSLTDAHSSIDEQKKRIELLEAVNSRLQATVDNLTSSLNEAEVEVKTALEAEEKKHSDITRSLRKENDELKYQVKYAEVKFLQTKKTEYLKRIEDKYLDASIKKQEFTQGLSMISGNLNPVVHSSMKTIFAQLSSYINELNAHKLEFVKQIDELIKKVEKGAFLKELKEIEMKKLPDPPCLQSVFPQLDKYLLNSTQMACNLLNIGSLPQVPSAAVIPQATASAAPSAKIISSANPSAAVIKPPNRATIIPQANPSAAVTKPPTVIPQTNASAAVIKPPTRAMVIQQATPSATIIPQATPSATIIPQATPSATIVPSTPVAAVIPPVTHSVLSSIAPILEANKSKQINIEAFDILNPQIQESFKNTGSSINSFTSIPYSVPTLDKEFNKTCAIFRPPEPVSNNKLDTPKVPPGIINCVPTSFSSKTTSCSSKDSLETFPSVEKTLGSLNAASKVNEPVLNSLEQEKKKATGNRISSSYDKLLVKLKEQFPSYSQDELIDFVKEFRAHRQGKLTGMAMDAIIGELSIMIKSKKNSEKKFHEPKVQPKPNKVLVNKKLVPDTKTPAVTEQQSVKKKSAWGTIDSDHTRTFSSNADDDCTICCDPMTDTSAYKVACGHIFHEDCIRQWLKNKSNCPVCRVLLLLPEEYPSLS